MTIVFESALSRRIGETFSSVKRAWCYDSGMITNDKDSVQFLAGQP